MTENHFKQDAKTLVDMLFDAKLFRDQLTRDQLNCIEGLIEFAIQSKFDMHKRNLEFLKTLKSYEAKTHPPQ